MGREVVRVPPGFEHPKDENGHYIEAANWEILDQVPDEECTHYVIYENTSGGTPVSPVFPTREGARDWLVEQGFSLQAAENFLDRGHAPSFAIGPGGVSSGIEALENISDAPMRRRSPEEIARQKRRDVVKISLIGAVILVWFIVLLGRIFRFIDF